MKRDTNKSVDVAIKVHEGKVLLTWEKPVDHIFFDPQSCFALAEHMARAAHRARFPGEPLRDDYHYLTQQVKQRLTEQMRDRLAIRIRTMLPGLLEKHKGMDYISNQIVDTIFSAIDPEGTNRLGKDLLS